MSETDLELYQYQLDQVEHSLRSDPNNEELLKLQTDLKELIALTSQYEQVSNNNENISSTTSTDNNTTSTLTGNRKRSRSPSTPPTTSINKKTSALVAHQFNIGQEVKAKWSQDGQYYKAIITAIGGADQIFSVQFRGYKDIEVVPLSDIQPLEKDKKKGIFEDISSSSANIYNTNNNGSSSIPTNSTTNNMDDLDNNNSNKNKKKDHKNKSQNKVSEVDVKKNAWLNFAGDKKKKKQKTSAINKKSIFKTPDNPDSKVGVVGSGRGMTSYQQRGRHSYNTADD